MIFISKPFLPPMEEYLKRLKKSWKNHQLTNDGPFVKSFEKRLNSYLGLKNSVYVSSGTMAIQLALNALNIKGEVITTPFSHIGTLNAIIWQGCNPVFVDIDKESFNIDASKIEKSITKNTKAILAVHCFGNPCNIEKIEYIAKKRNLKIIYDAAHCFGTKYEKRSVFDFGDISITSFHSTKIFHTVEGGALFSKNKKTIDDIRVIRSFGQKNHESFERLGINAKNSEFHAIMGLCNLKYVKKILKKREDQSKKYDSLFKNLPVEKQKIFKNTSYNYSYYPLIFKNEKILLRVKKKLEEENIFPRRYFYPSLNKISFLKLKIKCPVAEDIAKRILCLPLYHDLKKNEQEKISKTISISL